MQGKLLRLFIVMMVGVSSGLAVAKLPPLTEEQKAKAEEVKAKQAESAKKDAEALARVQDTVVERYKKMVASKGMEPKAARSAAPATASAPAVPTAPAAAANK